MMTTNETDARATPARSPRTASGGTQKNEKGGLVGFALVFEAESIQTYLHETNRLRDAVGASQIVDELCGSLEPEPGAKDLLARVLAAANVDGTQVRFARRGGGAFIALFASADARDRVRDLWALAMASHAPGLAWVDATGQGGTDLDAATDGMRAQRASRIWRAPSLPEIGPMNRRVPRTGRAAVAEISVARSGESADSATVSKRDAGGRSAALLSRFHADSPGGPGDAASLNWPTKLTADEDDDPAGANLFPLRGEENQIAFIHADGNGLGAALQALEKACRGQPEKYVTIYSSFSRAVSRATVAAARRATSEVLLPSIEDDLRVPARPLVLGGDDLSIIVRPDLALPFAQAFLQAFEDASKDELGQLDIDGCPKGLTAACGIAIVNAGHPFARAAELAEALCGHAKKVVKRRYAVAGVPPSSLMLHRTTSPLPAKDHDALGTLVIVLPCGRRLQLFGGPYALTDHEQLPSVVALQGLANALDHDAVSLGGLRQMFGAIEDGEPVAVAEDRWRLWRKALKQRSAAALSEVDRCLTLLGVDSAQALPFAPDADSPGVSSTPLADALLLSLMQPAPRVGDDPHRRGPRPHFPQQPPDELARPV